MSNIEKVLLTGFEPFWGYPRNVSQMTVQKITESGSYPFHVIGHILPTSFKKAPEVMAKVLTEIKPEIALSFGLLENISTFRIERIGLNINDALQADNDGNKPTHQHILPNGPVAYEVNLPFVKIATDLEEAGLPVEISYHAQTFVCNHLIYTSIHLITTERLPILYGFIHLPNLPEDVKEMPIGTPSMPFETVLKGVDIILHSLSL